ncbi:MAG: pit accessory protein [Pseudomonadota bacterium]|nr:pit accessory protein [Pseudomonadota bacterium]
MFSLQTMFGQGKQFYTLLEEAAVAAHDSTRALHTMLKDSNREPALDAFRLARQRERDASDKISQALVDSFITPIEREDIEALGSALYKIPKQVEKFADRYSLAVRHLEHIDFAPRAAMLEQASGVVVKMVRQLRHLKLEPMKALNDELRALENEADRLMLELYREIYSGKLDPLQMFLLKEFFEILEKAIDRCRGAGVVAYEIVLKNS